MDEQSQEREELEGVVSRLKERLERETAAHMECSERARAGAARAHQLEQQVKRARAWLWRGYPSVRGTDQDELLL